MNICAECMKSLGINKEWKEEEEKNLECDACKKFKQCIFIRTDEEKAWPNS